MRSGDVIGAQLFQLIESLPSTGYTDRSPGKADVRLKKDARNVSGDIIR